MARLPRAEEIKILSSNHQRQYDSAVRRTSEVRALGVDRLRDLPFAAKQGVIGTAP